jgi:hypothetical protein
VVRGALTATVPVLECACLRRRVYKWWWPFGPLAVGGGVLGQGLTDINQKLGLAEVRCNAKKPVEPLGEHALGFQRALSQRLVVVSP